jgi:hypothetical protein
LEKAGRFDGVSLQNAPQSRAFGPPNAANPVTMQNFGLLGPEYLAQIKFFVVAASKRLLKCGLLNGGVRQVWEKQGF